MSNKVSLSDLFNQGVLLSTFDTYVKKSIVSRFDYTFIIFQVFSFKLNIKYYTFSTFDNKTNRFYGTQKVFGTEKKVFDYISNLPVLNGRIADIHFRTAL